MSKEQSSTDRIKEVVTNDEPLGKQVPGAPFAVVGLTYIVILAAIALGLAFIIWMTT